MKECIDFKDLQTRVNKIVGQLGGIIKMTEEDARCEDILIQINAAKSAIHKIGQIFLENHFRTCVKNGIQHGDAEKTISDFLKAMEHFSKI